MRIEHVTLLVKNRAATLKFFEEQLELKHKYVGKHAWVIVGEQYIHITENSGPPVPNTFYHFAIEIEDINEYADKLKSRGVELIDEVYGQSFFIRDLDRNLIEFKRPQQ